MLISFTNIKQKYNMNIGGIIHIGGHFGEEIPEYVANNICNIIVFEPLSNNFDVLEKNIGGLDADIKRYQVALGSEEKGNDNGEYSYEVVDQSRSERMITRISKIKNVSRV